VIAGLMHGDIEITVLQQKPGTMIEVQALVLQALSTIISIEKIPYVVALCQLYLTGDVDQTTSGVQPAFAACWLHST
jgi:hypothetical protein